MRLKLIKPRNAIKQLLKLRPEREEMDNFKANLNLLLDNIDESRSEENQKNNVRDFLLNTYYKGKNEVNTKERADLVIHSGKDGNTPVSVLIETKRPTNKSEMISEGKLNVKALHEIVLYFLRERLYKKNLEVKYAIITNINEWYIIDAKHLQHAFADNKELIKQYDKWRLGQTTTSNNDVFYKEILAPIIEKSDAEIEAVYFNINDYKKELRNTDKENDRKLLALYKLLSPWHLLREPFANDSNNLNNNFYKELLHIIGVEERKEKGKVIIDRLEKGKRNYGSLLENTLTRLEKEDPLRRVENLSLYGDTINEQYYNIALELCLTWVNRVLFLKLLEGQLLSFHNKNHNYRFLHKNFISNYDELYELFHDVLAIHYDDRVNSIAEKYKHIPYLNSSLFDFSPLEVQALKVSSLKMNTTMPVHGSTVLKDDLKKKEELDTLEYLFRFLDAYDFTSVDKEDIQEDKRSLINASVLGKIFEKINGYKDGSIFTPGFITMYMSREALRRAVVQKFNEHHNWTCETFDDLYNHIDNKNAKGIKLANSIINSLKVCDPAVGSGHFLVSVMNELIAIKSELEILADEDGRKLKGYNVSVVDDELVVTDDEGIPFAYHPNSTDNLRIQKTLFHEKQTIIENCLFGVDINPNSVKICRLRLWIELLKNAYYKEEGKLETLPNIDINIKNGNSLLSRFPLDADLSEAFKSQKYSLDSYKLLIETYRHSRNRREKDELLQIIENIKGEYSQTIFKKDPLRVEIAKVRGQLLLAKNNYNLFGEKLSADKQQIEIKRIEKSLALKIQKLEEAESGAIYKNAFEWRFEFPEVLDSSGNFTGFDVVIGNPPYIQLQKFDNEFKAALQRQNYTTFAKTGDIYQLFYEQGVRLLRDKGHLVYITSNKWMRTDYGKGTRFFLGTECRPILVIDFGMAQLFDTATTYTNILLLSKAPPPELIKMCRVNSDFDKSILLEDYVDFSATEILNPKGNSWVAYDKKDYELIKKIISQGKPIKEWDININRGLLTGFNEAFIISTERRDQLVAEDPKSADIIKPILRGEDIKAYTPEWADLWLINTHNGIKELGIPRINAEKDYPAVYKWLQRFEVQLSKRYDKGEHWSNLRNCAYLQEFEKPKIIYPNMTKFMPFVYDKHQFFTNQKCFVITGDYLDYLTAFLNSKIFRYAFKEYFPELLGDTRELSKVFFETVTVKPVDQKTNEVFAQLVKQIQINKKARTPTFELENKIDVMLGEIYNLSGEEIMLISLEGAVAPPASITNNLSSFVNS